MNTSIVYMIDISTGEVLKEFQSIEQIQHKLGAVYDIIHSACIYGIEAYGYAWKYKSRKFDNVSSEYEIIEDDNSFEIWSRR